MEYGDQLDLFRNLANDRVFGPSGFPGSYYRGYDPYASALPPGLAGIVQTILPLLKMGGVISPGFEMMQGSNNPAFMFQQRYAYQQYGQAYADARNRAVEQQLLRLGNAESIRRGQGPMSIDQRNKITNMVNGPLGGIAISMFQGLAPQMFENMFGAAGSGLPLFNEGFKIASYKQGPTGLLMDPSEALAYAQQFRDSQYDYIKSGKGYAQSSNERAAMWRYANSAGLIGGQSDYKLARSYEQRIISGADPISAMSAENSLAKQGYFRSLDTSKLGNTVSDTILKQSKETVEAANQADEIRKQLRDTWQNEAWIKQEIGGYGNPTDADTKKKLEAATKRLDQNRIRQAELLGEYGNSVETVKATYQQGANKDFGAGLSREGENIVKNNASSKAAQELVDITRRIQEMNRQFEKMGEEERKATGLQDTINKEIEKRNNAIKKIDGTLVTREVERITKQDDLSSQIQFGAKMDTIAQGLAQSIDRIFGIKEQSRQLSDSGLEKVFWQIKQGLSGADANNTEKITQLFNAYTGGRAYSMKDFNNTVSGIGILQQYARMNGEDADVLLQRLQTGRGYTDAFNLDASLAGKFAEIGYEDEISYRNSNAGRGVFGAVGPNEAAERRTRSRAAYLQTTQGRQYAIGLWLRDRYKYHGGSDSDFAKTDLGAYLKAVAEGKIEFTGIDGKTHSTEIGELEMQSMATRSASGASNAYARETDNIRMSVQNDSTVQETFAAHSDEFRNAFDAVEKSRVIRNARRELYYSITTGRDLTEEQRSQVNGFLRKGVESLLTDDSRVRKKLAVMPQGSSYADAQLAVLQEEADKEGVGDIVRASLSASLVKNKLDIGARQSGYVGWINGVQAFDSSISSDESRQGVAAAAEFESRLNKRLQKHKAFQNTGMVARFMEAVGDPSMTHQQALLRMMGGINGNAVGIAYEESQKVFKASQDARMNSSVLKDMYLGRDLSLEGKFEDRVMVSGLENQAADYFKQGGLLDGINVIQKDAEGTIEKDRRGNQIAVSAKSEYNRLQKAIDVVGAKFHDKNTSASDKAKYQLELEHLFKQREVLLADAFAVSQRKADNSLETEVDSVSELQLSDVVDKEREKSNKTGQAIEELNKKDSAGQVLTADDKVILKPGEEGASYPADIINHGWIYDTNKDFGSETRKRIGGLLRKYGKNKTWMIHDETFSQAIDDFEAGHSTGVGFIDETFKSIIKTANTGKDVNGKHITSAEQKAMQKELKGIGQSQADEEQTAWQKWVEKKLGRKVGEKGLTEEELVEIVNARDSSRKPGRLWGKRKETAEETKQYEYTENYLKNKKKEAFSGEVAPKQSAGELPFDLPGQGKPYGPTAHSGLSGEINPKQAVSGLPSDLPGQNANSRYGAVARADTISASKKDSDMQVSQVILKSDSVTMDVSSMHFDDAVISAKLFGKEPQHYGDGIPQSS
ncbi:hypothetical protein FACS1894214_0080 [Planctomycetales bacterium]|nr:hypothetical protein FACS1894214_0080 [Planctomycetales bacterium]